MPKTYCFRTPIFSGFGLDFGASWASLGLKLFFQRFSAIFFETGWRENIFPDVDLIAAMISIKFFVLRTYRRPSLHIWLGLCQCVLFKWWPHSAITYVLFKWCMLPLSWSLSSKSVFAFACYCLLGHASAPWSMELILNLNSSWACGLKYVSMYFSSDGVTEQVQIHSPK